ncbi:hypothetical protein BH20ACT24_BH20ACT24_22660 [soil metagenome]
MSREDKQVELDPSAWHPDIEDVFRRAARVRRRRNTVTGVIAGVAAFGLVVGVLGGLSGRLRGDSDNRRGTGPAYMRTPLDGVAPAFAPPEGSFLVRGDGTYELVSGAGSRVLPAGIRAYDVSPDGRRVVGGRSEQFPSGFGRVSSLVVVDVETGAVDDLEVAGANESFGPASWSPNGAAVLYSRHSWVNSDFEASHPGQPEAQVACIDRLQNEPGECFTKQEPAYSVGWGPTSAQVTIAGGRGEPLTILDVATGAVVRTILPMDDPLTAQALAEAGMVNAPSVQAVNPVWSASGLYLATLLMFDTETSFSTMPVVLSPVGTLVAAGNANRDPSHLAWSPTSDLLAYNTGNYLRGSGVPEPAVAHLLDPATGNSTEVHSTAGEANVPGQTDVFVTGLFWSPSGRWLAFEGLDELRLIDIGGDEETQVIAGALPGDHEAILDWAVGD